MSNFQRNIINVKGIAWICRKYNQGTIFTHRNVWVGLDPRTDTFQSKSRMPLKSGGHRDIFILARAERAQALKDATVVVLENYASKFIPTWGNVQAQA